MYTQPLSLDFISNRSEMVSPAVSAKVRAGGHPSGTGFAHHNHLATRADPLRPEPAPPAAQVVAALQAIGLLDANLLIKEDPRYTKLPWRAQLGQVRSAHRL